MALWLMYAENAVLMSEKENMLGMVLSAYVEVYRRKLCVNVAHK